MKKTKRLLAVLLAGMLAASLAGCGGSGDSPDTTASAGGGASASDGGSSEEMKTLSIMGTDTLRTVGDQEVYLSDWVEGDSQLWDRVESDLAERGLQLELDLILEDQFETVCQTQLAAGMPYDMFRCNTLDMQTMLDLAEDGTIVPVNDIWENHSDGTAKEYYTSGRGAQSVALTSLEDGKMYWLSEIVGGDYNGIDTGSPCGPQIRLDWLNQVGLEVPTTTEEFTAALQAFQDADVNGSGEKDEVASYSMEAFGNGIAQWFGLGSHYVYVPNDSDTATSPWYQTEQVQAYITYMKSLVDAGLLDTSGQESQKTAENKISANNGWGAVAYIEPTISVQEGADPPYLQMVVCQAMDGVEPLVPIQSGYMVNRYFAFTSQCDLDAAGIYLDYICTSEFETLTEYGIEGYTYTVNEDGSYSKLQDTEGNLEVQCMNANLALWGNAVLPRMYTCDREAELNVLSEGGYPLRAEAIADIYENGNAADLSYDQDLAPLTAEELARTNEIEADLSTYSSELLTTLILGQKSMDDWDTYIADLQRLGLDELIEITQARYDRANG